MGMIQSREVGVLLYILLANSQNVLRHLSPRFAAGMLLMNLVYMGHFSEILASNNTRPKPCQNNFEFAPIFCKLSACIFSEI